VHNRDAGRVLSSFGKTMLTFKQVYLQSAVLISILKPIIILSIHNVFDDLHSWIGYQKVQLHKLARCKIWKSMNEQA
jgi:hypothetical protein